MAGNTLIAQLASESAADKREQPWKAFIEEPKAEAQQNRVEFVKVGGIINVMTNLLYVCPVVFRYWIER